MVMTAFSPRRQELVVVTGASTGIGAATARKLARSGFHVFAGVRRDVDAESLRTERIEPHILDITVESDVVAIADRLGRPGWELLVYFDELVRHGLISPIPPSAQG